MKSSILIPENPYSIWFPDGTKYCNRKDINELHREVCETLNVFDVYLGLTWKFEPKFRSILGQAEYWNDSKGHKYWRIRYASKFWLPLGEAGRRNTIIHEVCHLAVEKLYGHCARPEKDKERVLSHGKHFRELMLKCGEDPDLDVDIYD